MPSPSPEHPGLFIRDPYRFTDAMLIIPPVLVECLQCFDGRQTELDLRAALVRITGDLEVRRDWAAPGRDAERRPAFWRTRISREMQQERARGVRRGAGARAGACRVGVPGGSGALRETMARYMDGRRAGTAASSPDGPVRHRGAARQPGRRLAIATAPRIGMLRPEHADRTFVILATSHYGEPETFGLTRKTFRHAAGRGAPPIRRLVDWLAARGGDGVEMEDYCHSFEHTVELQVVFLQHMLRAGRADSADSLRLLRAQPVPGRQSGRRRRRAGASSMRWASCTTREGDRLFWVLGVDMAHMGARYHDRFAACAGEGDMAEVRERDEQRIERINALDAGGFWDLVQREQRRSEVVRFVAVLHVPEDGAAGARASCCTTSSGISTTRAW